ncbi:hypothetical protein [Cellvibrio sp. PSBB023]|uniref:hypothetical protein n=1 Tax=Cellvibrio sp. PSBB023 TaxID=1945512 RepID=UPI00098EF1B7|nr:hypothetical protein [Cellvibrio sp. PSBB023]AQT58896.1 hypothetical protein B0D95_01420 [Cellvibrio sp. PSBB023]
MTLSEAFFYGVIGGSLPEVLALYNLRHLAKGKKPVWVTSWYYWIVTLIMVLLGGATVVLYQKIGININEFMAVHLGIATPLLISTATKEKPKID